MPCRPKIPRRSFAFTSPTLFVVRCDVFKLTGGHVPPSSVSNSRTSPHIAYSIQILVAIASGTYRWRLLAFQPESSDGRVFRLQRDHHHNIVPIPRFIPQRW